MTDPRRPAASRPPRTVPIGTPPLRSGSSAARPRAVAHAPAAIHALPAAVLHMRSTPAPPAPHARAAKITGGGHSRRRYAAGGAGLKASMGRWARAPH